MSNNPQLSPNIELAAFKKNAAAPLDLMRPGLGTPWEDRGAIGFVPAYIKTTLRSLTSPALLFDHIRRPEITSDGMVYMWASAVMWVVSVLAYNIYWLNFVLPHQKYYEPEYDTMFFWLTVLGEAALFALGVFLFVRLGSQMFLALAGAELKGVSPSLVSNCFCYALGPSILAVVPFYGWAIAAIWIYVNLIVAGKRRLYLKGGGAYINATLIFFTLAAAAVVGYIVIYWLWNNYLGMNGLMVHIVVKSSRPGAP